MEDFQKMLLSLADDEYQRFQCALMPTVDPARVIGVRTPALRKLAKALTEDQRRHLLDALPHRYYEEDNLHAFAIEQITDYDACIKELDRFLPYVDNWATCDMMRPRVFVVHKTALFEKCREWMASSHEFTVRYGIEMLMVHGLDDAYDPSVLMRVAAVNDEAYYVHMMIAWFFATALSKHFDDVVDILERRMLREQTHRKAIQKAVESRVITAEQKRYLKTLK